MKKASFVPKPGKVRWVGDGFPVRTVLTPQRPGATASPFLLVDHVGPHEFAPSEHPRGVEEHPHRGFETVTLVYSGEVEHRDSAGGGGVIGPGDVQWMTAGSGLMHEEMHGREFTRRGGILELIQMWVNLPARHKQEKPVYQFLPAERIPTVPLLDNAGALRVIAGQWKSTKGPARTYTPLSVWDLTLGSGAQVTLPIPEGHNSLVLVRTGQLDLGFGDVLGAGSLATFSQEGNVIGLTASQATTALVLTGEPILEPVAAYGPFVMNTQAELHQAIEDYHMGRIEPLKPRASD